MNGYTDKAHPPVAPSLPQEQSKPALETPTAYSREHMIQFDLMNSSLRLQEIPNASQLLAQHLEIRETRIAALMKDVESRHYSIKAEQVAEKILQHHLLDLFYLSVAHTNVDQPPGHNDGVHPGNVLL